MPSDELLAHHEVGHAAVAMLLDVGVEFVSIDRTANGHEAVCCIDTAAVFRNDLETIAARILLKLSGPIAEMMYQTADGPGDGELDGEWHTDTTTRSL